MPLLTDHMDLYLKRALLLLLLENQFQLPGLERVLLLRGEEVEHQELQILGEELEDKAKGGVEQQDKVKGEVEQQNKAKGGEEHQKERELMKM
jgi:hypothetical protein